MPLLDKGTTRNTVKPETRGTARKATTQDSLAGANQIQPTTRRPPSISGSANAQGPSELINSATTRALSKVSAYAGQALNRQVAARKEKSDMAGRVAFEQGKTFEAVEMEGDKYALQGYRVMQAQTASSSLFAQQKQAIESGGYESSPEDYAATYATALEEAIVDLDPTTAQMVKEGMTRQMPQLVGAHMTLHLQDQEKKAFTSLATSIDIMSQDDTADDDLLLNALGGPDAPSAGLSTARRTAAVVQGVEMAFKADNPKAYAKLVKTGALDNLDNGQINKLRVAEEAFQKREAKKVNTDWMAAETDVLTRTANGELSPVDAVNEYVTAAAGYGIEVEAQEARVVYLSAAQAQEYNQAGAVVAIEEATLRGDYKSIARITEAFMVEAESGGDPDAVSPVGAMGTHQVMPATMADPGYGIKPADIADPADVARVGKEYWATMIAGKAENRSLNWQAGDVEAAAIAYNAGPANAIKWIDAGRDYSVLPKRSETEPYAKGILAKAQGKGVIPPKEKLARAQALKKQTEDRINLAAYEQYQVVQLSIDEELSDGKLTDAEYIAKSNGARSALRVERTKATTKHITSSLDALHSTVKEKADVTNLELLDARKAELTNQFESSMSKEGMPPEYYQSATQSHISNLATLYAKEGYNVSDMGYSGIIDHATKQLSVAMDKYDDWNVDQNRIDRAVATNTVAELPKALIERTFKQVTDTVGQGVADAVETGEIPEELAGDSTQKFLEDNYLSIGMVDPQVKLESSAAISGDLIDGKGGTNMNALRVIESYVRLKRADPAVAATMFDEAGLVKANAVIAAGGGINAPVKDGMLRLSQSMMGVGNIDFSDPKIMSNTTTRINRAVEGRFGFGGIVRTKDVGVVQAVFGDAELEDRFNRSSQDRKILQSEATATQLKSYIGAEVTRMAKHLPGADPQYLVEAATAQVSKHTEFIGGSLIKMDDGYDMKGQLFGTEIKEYDKEGVVNTVIVDHLRELSKQPDFGFIDETSLLQAWNPFGKDVDSPRDVVNIREVGVRPFTVVGDGKNVYVQINLQTGGVSPPIWLDLPEIGKAYKERYKTRFKSDEVPTE